MTVNVDLYHVAEEVLSYVFTVKLPFFVSFCSALVSVTPSSEGSHYAQPSLKERELGSRILADGASTLVTHNPPAWELFSAPSMITLFDYLPEPR